MAADDIDQWAACETFARKTLWRRGINLCLVPFLFLQVLERPTLRCSPYCGSSDNTWMQQVGHSSDPEIDKIAIPAWIGYLKVFLIKHLQESNWHTVNWPTMYCSGKSFFCTANKKTADLFMSFGQVSGGLGRDFKVGIRDRSPVSHSAQRWMESHKTYFLQSDTSWLKDTRTISLNLSKSFSHASWISQKCATQSFHWRQAWGVFLPHSLVITTKPSQPCLRKDKKSLQIYKVV